MGPYLYATMDIDENRPEFYEGILVEDVREDYQEVARFHSGSFSDDVQAYLTWADAAMKKNEAVEIYESDALRDRIKALNLARTNE